MSCQNVVLLVVVPSPSRRMLLRMVLFPTQLALGR